MGKIEGCNPPLVLSIRSKRAEPTDLFQFHLVESAIKESVDVGLRTWQ